nr:16S rRNA (guanine(966)-N(2))-methyltransferase RsmD [Euzebyales bacterium]
LLERLAGAGGLAREALLVVERDRRGAPPPASAWLLHQRTRSYGDTVLYYLRASDRTTP